MKDDVIQNILNKKGYLAGMKLDEDNPIFFKACELVLETDKPIIYLTGKAGTGKTTFLKYIASQYRGNKVILAPTARAAVNAGGQTIHSFFKLDFNPHLPNEVIFQKQNIYHWLKYKKEKEELIKNLSLIIIDEVSMVRCDVLDSIDLILRAYRRQDKPFGGVRVLLIGDVFQLPPIARPVWEILRKEYDSPYFFSSKVYKGSVPAYIELEKPYRQQEEEFLSLLDKIRVNNISDGELAMLNSRAISPDKLSTEENTIFLAPTNYDINKYNNEKYSRLNGDEFVFQASINGDYPKSLFPVEEFLRLKIGAQVMIMKNKWDAQNQSFTYYNGNIGIVKDIKDTCIIVELKEGGLEDERLVEVEKDTWENIEYKLVEKEEVQQDGKVRKTRTVEAIIKGTFAQYPLKLAWAVSIHKSQGMTFDSIYADLSSCFDYGQVYVALSRCKRLNGVHLLSPITRHSIKTDYRVLRFAQTKTPNTLVVQEIEEGKANKLYRQFWDNLSNGNISEALINFEKAIKARDDRNTEAFKKHCSLIYKLFNHYKSQSSKFYTEKEDIQKQYEKDIERQKYWDEIDVIVSQQSKDCYEVEICELNEAINKKDLLLVIEKAKNETNKAKIQDLNEQNTSNITKIKDLKAECASYHDKIQRLEGKNEVQVERIQRLEDMNRKLQKEIDRWNNMTWWQRLRKGK